MSAAAPVSTKRSTATRPRPPTAPPRRVPAASRSGSGGASTTTTPATTSQTRAGLVPAPAPSAPFAGVAGSPRRSQAEGAVILLVEDNVARALDLADRAYVLEEGRVVTDGPAATLRAQPHIPTGVSRSSRRRRPGPLKEAPDAARTDLASDTGPRFTLNSGSAPAHPAPRLTTTRATRPARRCRAAG